MYLIKAQPFNVYYITNLGDGDFTIKIKEACRFVSYDEAEERIRTLKPGIYQIEKIFEVLRDKQKTI